MEILLHKFPDLTSDKLQGNIHHVDSGKDR